MFFVFFSFFFNVTATTEIYTLSLHDALPIWSRIPLYLLPYYGGYDRYWSQSSGIQNITSLDYGKFYMPSTEYLVGTIKQKFSNLHLILLIHVFASSLLCFYSAAKKTSMPDINPVCCYLSAFPREFSWTIKNGKTYA